MTTETETTYSIKTAARMVDMNSHTIRAWERRYKALDPHRHQANNRRQYTEDDISRLTLLAKLVKSGHQISHVAPLSTEHLLSMTRGGSLPSAQGIPDDLSALESQILTRCVGALEMFELGSIHAELEAARHVLSARQFLMHIAVPLLRIVGDRVAEETLSIAQEHALSSILKSQLSQIFFNLRNSIAIRAFSRKDQSPGKVFCLATREGDFHEFGIMAAAILIAYHGHVPFYFGANLPATALSHASLAVNADYLIVGNTPSGNPKDEHAQAQYAHELVSLATSKVEIWWGGDLLFSPDHLRLRLIHISTLSDLEEKISNL